MNLLIVAASVILLVASFRWTASETIDKECKQLPNGCKMRSYLATKDVRHQICVCQRIDQSFAFSDAQLDKIYNCTSFVDELYGIYFFLSNYQIFDDSFDLDNIMQFWLLYQQVITVRYVKGFDIDRFRVKNVTSLDVILEFVFSKFEFYSQNRRIKSCHDLINASPQSIFHVFNNRIDFTRSSFKTPVCPLIFRNSSVKSYLFEGFVNTFYKSNVLNFESMLGNTTIDINSPISDITFLKFVKIDINSRLLDKIVFKKLRNLFLYGEIESIQSGLFKDFKKLKFISLNAIYFQMFSHRRGIDWMFDLNSDLRVDLHNISSFNITFLVQRYIIIDFQSINEKGLLTGDSFNTIDKYFPYEDFCLYKNLPFNQLLVFYPYFYQDSYPCTFVWFIQYYSISNTFIYKYYQNRMNLLSLSDLIKACNFEKMLNNCKKTSDFMIITSHNDIKPTMLFIQCIILVLVPFVCIFGIITNVLVVCTVSHKDNEKNFKENQYNYMRLNALFNIIILVIEPITLVSECQDYELAAFCSQIRTWMFSQFFKIIFGEYVSNVLRLAANFSYLVFALNRLSLIGKDHGKLVTKTSKLKISGFFLRFFAPCLILPVVKVFRFLPNSYIFNNDYPLPIGYYFHDIGISLVYVFLAFNALYDFINYVLFLIINLAIDISLAITMKQAISEKEKNKLGQQKSQKVDKSSKSKKDDPVKRTVILVILNATCGLMLKLPLASISIFDLLNFIKVFLQNIFATFEDGLKTCFYLETCYAFEKLANLLFLFSLSLYFMFYYNFDKNFRISFKRIYNKKSNKVK